MKKVCNIFYESEERKNIIGIFIGKIDEVSSYP